MRELLVAYWPYLAAGGFLLWLRSKSQRTPAATVDLKFAEQAARGGDAAVQFKHLQDLRDHLADSGVPNADALCTPIAPLLLKKGAPAKEAAKEGGAS